MTEDKLAALHEAQARKSLEELIETFERIGKGHMLWFAKAARAYLDGEFETLDEALGLELDDNEESR